MSSFDSIDSGDPHVADRIEAYLASGLTAEEGAALEAHVAGCDDCRALLDEARDSDATLIELFAATRPDEAFEDRVVNRVQKAAAPRGFGRIRAGLAGQALLHPSVRRAAVGIAAAVVLAAVGHAAQSALEHQTLPGMRNGMQFADLGTKLAHWRDEDRRYKAIDELRQTGMDMRVNSENKLQNGALERTSFSDGFAANTASKPSGDGWGGWAPQNPAGTVENMVLGLAGGLGGDRTTGPAAVTTPSLALGFATVNGNSAAVSGPMTGAVTGTSSINSLNTFSGGTQNAGGTLAFSAKPTDSFGYQVGGAVTGKTPVVATTGGGPLDTNGVTELGRQVTLGDARLGTNPYLAAGDLGGQAPAATNGLNEGFKPTELALPAGGSTGGEANKQAPLADAKPSDTAAPPADQAQTAAPSPPVQTRVYDVRDLVLNGPNSPDGPKFDLSNASPAGGAAAKDAKDAKEGATGGLFGGSVGTPADAGKTREQAVEDLTKLIQETVAADSWKDTGGQDGAIRELNGQIVVTQTPENQRRIGELLQQLRGPKKTVTAETTPDSGAQATKPQAAEPGAAPESTAPPAPTPPGAAPVAAPTPTPAPPPVPAPPRELSAAELQAQAMQRKIIRNGEMLFDVDSFDSSMMLVGKIAAEEGGFISTTDSEKLPNGKVKGSVIVRCPPERLDTLVLKLRGLGDLESQRIAAQDITKQYTDLESQLRAAQAMEDRLLGIIKDGKGAIKDLLEAEKQLGVWREKLEALEGEIRYYNNLVSLSTLTVTLTERDIKTPYATAQSELVSMGVEAEDVEKARADAISQIEAAKGRILESDLKKHEAAQFSATIVADVAADAADPLIDRLKQIGRVARLERERKQTSEGGTGAPPPGVKIERQDTRLQLSIYNLADISPRTTTNMNLAAADVEQSYKAIIDQVKSGGGRIVSSQLNRPKADQVTGTIAFDVPSDKADVLSAAIRSGVEVMRLDVNENKDTQDLTDAKRGFVLQIYSLASVAPRETTILQIASKDVPGAFNKLLETARTAGGRVSTSQLNEQNVANITGTLDFDVPRDNLAGVEAALREAGVTVTRNVTRSPDSDSTVDSKVRLEVTLIDEVNLAARQTIAQSLSAKNVPEAFSKLAEALHDAGARVITSQLNDQDKPTVNAQINFTIEREDLAKADAALREAGETVGRSVGRSADLQNTVDTKVAYQVTILDMRNLQPRETVTELVAVRDVPGRYAGVLETLRLLDAQIYASQLIQQNRSDVSAVLDFAVRRDSIAGKESVEKALGESADIFSRTAVRSQDVTGTVDTRIRYQVTLRDADTQPPRETYTLEAEAPDVDRALADLEAAGVAAGGRAVDSTPSTTRNDKGEPIGRIVMDVPLARAGEIVNAVREKGPVTATRRLRDDRVPQGELSRARIEVTIGTGAIMAGEGGLWDTIKSGLRTSATGLLYALQFLIIGLCLIGPFLIGLWVMVRMFRWARRKPAKPQSPGTPPQGPAPAAG
jgi:glycine cleavage system regulatory protein